MTVRFPNLGTHDVIIPGTAKLAFNITLQSEDDTNRTIVKNLGRAIIKQVTVKIDGNEVYSLHEADVWGCYKDLWLTKDQLKNMVFQGIESDNIGKIRMNAGNKAAGENEGKDKAIADPYGTCFCIPLDFELLTDHMPFYQAGLGDRLSYELTFNNYSRVLLSSDTDCKFH